MGIAEPLQIFGVFSFGEHVYLYGYRENQKIRTFQVFTSADGLQFYYYDDTGQIIRENGAFEDIRTCADFRVSSVSNGYIGVYNRKNNNTKIVCTAFSHDGIHWHTISSIDGVDASGMVVPGYQSHNQYVLYSANDPLTIAFSFDLLKWQLSGGSTQLFPKNQSMKLGTLVARDEGIYAFYFSKEHQQSNDLMTISCLLFDKEEPGKLLWRKPRVIWHKTDTFPNEEMSILGLVYHNEQVISYWRDTDGSLFAIPHAFSFAEPKKSNKSKELRMIKHRHNPILTPIHHHVWESDAVFNAAAIYDHEKVHLIYRAVGSTGVSMLGYATSSDGVTIDHRHAHPIYIPTQPFEGSRTTYKNTIISQYVSGPGSGGCEDPRISKIDGRYYLVYVAFDGWSPPRLSLTSIGEDDFKSKNWQWEKPVLISPPGIVDKSGCILPEKIDGKYVILHRIYPDILIDFVDTLSFDGNTFVKGEYTIKPRKNYWDSRKVGIGATPMKTNDGWLVIYNAVDERDDSRYKIGAMLLDLSDPTQVIARSDNPILEPTEQYENSGYKYGVVYPCGAVILKDNLIVYYGGSDTVLCAATAPIKPFINELKTHGSPRMTLSAPSDPKRVLFA